MSESIEAKLRVILASVLRVDVILVGVDASTDTILAWDSLSHMKLILALEEEFDMTFDESQIECMTSLGSIAAIISSSENFASEEKT